jgi:uncharacterized protein
VNDLFMTSTGKLRPLWRFVLSALATYVVIFCLPYLTYSLRIPEHFTWAVDRGFTALLLFALYISFLRIADGSESPSADLGFDRARAIPQFLYGALFGASLVTIAVMGIALVGKYRVESVGGSVIVPLFLVTITLVGGALAEELAFRGYPFQRLVDAIGPTGAILAMSMLFSAIHAFNPSVSRLGLANTVLIGVLFSIAFLLTRSLWLVWGMHFGWNFMLGVVAGLPVSGLTTFAVVLRGKTQGPVWLTGGDYGIEGSLNATLVILLGMLVLVPLLWRTKRTSLGTDRGIQVNEGCISKPEGE